MNGLDLYISSVSVLSFLTGYDDFKFARKAIKLGADDYLLKLFKRRDIARWKRKTIQSVSASREFGQSWLNELGRNRLADSQLTLKDGLSTWFLQCTLESVGLPFRTTSSRGSTLASHDRSGIYEIAIRLVWGLDIFLNFAQAGCWGDTKAAVQSRWNIITCPVQLVTHYYIAYFWSIGGLYYQTSSIRQLGGRQK